MIISNIGTIVLSLPSRTSSIPAFVEIPSTVLMTTTQVRLLSLANTVSRLVVGPLADIVSRVPSPAIDGNHSFLKKYRISRIAFLTFSTTLLVCTYTWMVIGIREQASVWALRYVLPSFFSSPTGSDYMRAIRRDSIGAGLAYGCAFTVLYVPLTSHFFRHRLLSLTHHITSQPLHRLLHLGPLQSSPQLRHHHLCPLPRYPRLFVPLRLHLCRPRLRFRNQSGRSMSRTGMLDVDV